MDKKNVQKSIWRNLFAQKRAALGNLRNFFGRTFATPYMVLKFLIRKNHKSDHDVKKGTNREVHVPFWGVLISGKKLSPISGVRRIRLMSLFGGFLFPEKSFCPFRGYDAFA